MRVSAPSRDELQGVIKDLKGEDWGMELQFAGTEAGAGTETFVDDPNDAIKWALRRLYYRQRRFRGANGRYADDHHVRRAVQRVGSRRVDGQGICAPDNREVHLRAFASADPIELFLPGFSSATTRP